MPGFVVHFHLHQDIAGKELALTAALLSFLHLDDFLGRHQDLAELVLQTQEFDALFERSLYLVFEIGIRVNDVPA